MAGRIKSYYIFILAGLILLSISGCAKPKQEQTVRYSRDFSIDLSGLEAEYVVADIVNETKSVDPTAMIDVPEDDIMGIVENFFHFAYLSLDDDISNHVDELFTADTIVSALADLETISQSSDKTKLKGIIDADPTTDEFKVYINQDLKPSLAIVSSSLNAMYMQSDGRKAELDAKGWFALNSEDGQWRIFSYKLEKKMITIPEETNAP